MPSAKTVGLADLFSEPTIGVRVLAKAWWRRIKRTRYWWCVSRYRDDYRASSANYGMVPKDATSLLAGACPVVGSFGGRDLTLRGAAQRLRTALETNGVPHDVKEYPAAGHGFLNDHERAGDPIPLMVRLTAPLMRYGPHEDSARDARRRITEFFAAHLT